MIIFGHAFNLDDLNREELDLIQENEEISDYVHFAYSVSGADITVAAFGVVMDIDDDLFNPIYLDQMPTIEDATYKKVEYMLAVQKLPESLIQKFHRAYPSLFSIVLNDD